jgi:putative RNA 2'-phosphotransferase
MLRECRDHGYFRGEDCPICGEEGKFLASQEELDNLGRLMAGVLIDMREFTQAVQLRRRDFHWLRSHHIHAIIETDPKGRYQFKNGSIRATYGHSFDVDLELPSENIPDELFYPTTEEEVDILLETGIRPSDRKKVHLSKTFDDAEIAGKHRVEEPIILEIDAKSAVEKGVLIQKAGTTVFVTDMIPPEFLKRSE